MHFPKTMVLRFRPLISLSSTTVKSLIIDYKKCSCSNMTQIKMSFYKIKCQLLWGMPFKRLYWTFLLIKLFNNQQNEKLTLKRQNSKDLPQKSTSEIEARYVKISQCGKRNPKNEKENGKIGALCYPVSESSARPMAS